MKEYDIKRYTGQHQCFFSHGIKTSRKQTGQSTSEHWKQILKKALGPLKLLKHHYLIDNHQLDTRNYNKS